MVSLSLFSFWIFFPVSRFTSLELNWSYKRNEIHGFNFTRPSSPIPLFPFE